MDKKALRAEIRERKAAMTPAQIEACSRALTRQALACPMFQAAPSVYGYLSYNQEVRTLALLQAALDAGKRVAVPKVLGDTMRFLWISISPLWRPATAAFRSPWQTGPRPTIPMPWF